MVRGLLAVVAVMTVVVAGYCFLVMIDENQKLGGDAINGYVRDGHYYVRNHGRSTEVTAEQWEVNRAHNLRVLVTHPLGLLAMGYLVIGVILPYSVGRRSPEGPERLRKLVASGPVLASDRCRARIGMANLSVRLAVHPGGLIIHPMWMGERAIPSMEISAVRKREGLFVSGIEIEHRGMDVASPILLRLNASGAAATTLLRWGPAGFRNAGSFGGAA